MNARQRRKAIRKLTRNVLQPNPVYKYLPCSKNEDDLFRLEMAEHVQRCLDRFHDRVWHALFSDFAQKKPLR